MIWAARYIGLPYADQGRDRAGVDCWGLARLVYREELEIDLPSCAGDYTSAEEAREVNAVLAGAPERNQWRCVDVARAFDLFELRTGRLASHVGIAVGSDLMLHVHADGTSKIERLAPRWSSRVVGIYRHENML